MKLRKRLHCLLFVLLCLMLTACSVGGEIEQPPEPVYTQVVRPDSTGEVTWGDQTFSIHAESLMLNLQVRSNEILDLSVLSYCTQLRSLSLNVTVVPHIYKDKFGDPHIAEYMPTDLAPLAALGSLERLELNVNAIKDLTPLSGLPDLTTLVLWVEGDVDLTPLTSCTSLISLSLGGRGTADLTPLSRCEALSKLRVDLYEQEWKLPDLSALSGASSLKVLSVGGCNGLSKLEDVPLERLVDHNDGGEILENLPNLDTLTAVEFSDEHIDNIQSLLRISSVTEIVLEVGMQDIASGTELTGPNDPVLDQLITSIPIAQLREFLAGGGSITLMVSRSREA